MAVTSRVDRDLALATCFSADALGHCVQVVGKSGGLYGVTKFDPAVPGNTQAMAIIVHKFSATLCKIRFRGKMSGVYTSLTPGIRYWVGTDSKLTDTKPTPGIGSSLHLQLMGVATASDELMLRPEKPAVIWT